MTLLALLILGLLAVLFVNLRIKLLGSIFGILALVSGSLWCCLAPFPISLAGGFCALIGGLVINRL